MPLIQLVIALVIVGVALWAINTYIPMEATLKKILTLLLDSGVVEFEDVVY